MSLEWFIHPVDIAHPRFHADVELVHRHESSRIISNTHQRRVHSRGLLASFASLGPSTIVPNPCVFLLPINSTYQGD